MSSGCEFHFIFSSSQITYQLQVVFLESLVASLQSNPCEIPLSKPTFLTELVQWTISALNIDLASRLPSKVRNIHLRVWFSLIHSFLASNESTPSHGWIESVKADLVNAWPYVSEVNPKRCTQFYHDHSLRRWYAYPIETKGACNTNTSILFDKQNLVLRHWKHWKNRFIILNLPITSYFSTKLPQSLISKDLPLLLVN